MVLRIFRSIRIKFIIIINFDPKYYTTNIDDTPF